MTEALAGGQATATPGANLGATRANDFPRQANESRQPGGKHASSGPIRTTLNG
jgi:hypothetical protein